MPSGVDTQTDTQTKTHTHADEGTKTTSRNQAYTAEDLTRLASKRLLSFNMGTQNSLN